MKLMRTEDAVGQVLCHDITRIIKGVSKGPVFRKGHVIAPEDIPVLKSVGKEHIYIWEKDDTKYHEDEAAGILRDICMGEGMKASEPREGKIELTAEREGLLRVDVAGLNRVNGLGEMMIAARMGGLPVKPGDKLAGTRIIPLVIEKEKMERAREAAGEEPFLQILPFKKMKAGLVTTGNEVYAGLIEDTFSPVIRRKLAEYGCEVTDHVILDDSPGKITDAIRQMLDKGLDMVLCTGGMSVDPDDKTPLAIRNGTDRVVTYGAPVLPGAMFMLAYSGDGRPVVGLPGCVMYAGRTVFDQVLPWLLAGVPVTGKMLSVMGQGGLCLGCGECHYPNCGFGAAAARAFEMREG